MFSFGKASAPVVVDDERIRARFQVRHPGFTLDVDLDLPGRGVSALFGHSGSGKTSCLRCFAGLDQPSQGYLEVNGELWQDSTRGIFVPAHQRAVGYVFQDANLFAHLSVRGNLQYGLMEMAMGAQIEGRLCHLKDGERPLELPASLEVEQ